MILENLKNEFNNISILSEDTFVVHCFDFKKVILYMKNNSLYSADMLLTLSVADFSDCFELAYVLYSSQLNQKYILKTHIGKENPCAESVCDIFASANWDERENYDLFGIKFLNHPDLRRLFMPENWQGHPLRKDYVLSDKRLEWAK